MLTALDVPEASLNDAEKNIVAKIREHGWFCTSVIAEEGYLGFSYTTGFWKSLGAPEIVVFSLPSETAHDLLWNAYRYIKDMSFLPIGSRTSVLAERFDLTFLPVRREEYQNYILSSRWFYGSEDFPCIQMIWPDTANLFPWQSGFDSRFAADQPDLSIDGWDRQPN